MVNSRGSVLHIAVLVAIVVGNHIVFTRISLSEYTFPLAGTIVYHSLQVIGSVYAGWISARYFSPSGVIAIVAGRVSGNCVDFDLVRTLDGGELAFRFRGEAEGEGVAGEFTGTDPDGCQSRGNFEIEISR